MIRINRVLNRSSRRTKRQFKGKRFIRTGRAVTASPYLLVGGLTLGASAIYYLTNRNDSNVAYAAEAKVDYNAVKRAIAGVLNNDNYDDGSYGPVLVRLAWHAAGTYSKQDSTGGSNGATMRFEPESLHGANAGLLIARQLLEPIKARFPGLSYADLWTLAGCVAIEEMGGPKIPWRSGRSDAPSGRSCPVDGRLPDAGKGENHIREVFYRMGLNDQEIVALIGAHVLGRAHTDRSGFSGPWTNSPTTFSNDFFVQLKERKWTKKRWNGPEQFEDESKALMMLPADLAFLKDPKFKQYVDLYAQNEDRFFKDFASAFSKLLELGCTFPKDSKYI